MCYPVCMHSTVIGHRQILDFFDRARSQGTLSHAYCLVGPSKVGRRHIARYVGAQLCETSIEAIDAHPDFVNVARERDAKTSKLKRDISIDQIRELTSRLRRSSFNKDGYKVAIIDGAEHLSRGASNALLKTLEEPRSKTIIFLIVEDERQLLATIRSRCHVLYVNPVPVEELGDLSAHVDAKQLSQALGRPGVLKEWMETQELFSEHRDAVSLFESMLGKPLYEKMQTIDHLFGDKTDHIAAREKLIQTLDVWNVCIRDMLLANIGQGASRVFSHNDVSVDTKVLFTIEKQLTSAKQLLKQNIHPRLVVETILLHLP